MKSRSEELREVLVRTSEFVRSSNGSMWAALQPAEVNGVLDREIRSLREKGRLVDEAELASLFTVTAEIQEIAMANGWSDEYLALASEFDRSVERFRA